MLPEIKARPDKINLINAFRGINKNLYVRDDEFAEMKNMTNDYYPVLANRRKRGIIKTLDKPQGALGGRFLAYVDDNKLYYDENYICDLEETDVERQLVMMGAYLCVFPDGLIYNTYNTEISHIENEVTKSNVTISLCKLDGTVYDSTNTVVSNSEPSDHSKYWLDTSQDKVVMKVFNSSTLAWMPVATTYVKFEAQGIGVGFEEYDAVRFSGVDSGSWVYNDYDFNQTNIVYAKDDNALIVVGLINLNHTNVNNITVKREMPEMDFVCENGNRLWGCSSNNHEVYASKAGDPTNWNFFGGLDSDSYAATVGTQNIFTGIVSYSGYVFFFKEDGYHKLYGNKPSNYELQWKPGRGVQFGSDKSICVVDDQLIFKARDGVCVYNGSLSIISENLGVEPYYEAVAGCYRHKYYLSMRDNDYQWHLFVYDVSKGLWIREDDLQCKYMAYTNNGMYMIDYNNRLIVVNNEDMYVKLFPADIVYPSDDIHPGNIIAGELEDEIEWSFTTGDLGTITPYYAYIKRINIRLMLEPLTKVKIQIMYDSSEDWEDVWEYYSTRKKSIEIPIPVQRSDHFQLRFSGNGEMRLYSIAKAIEEGSGVNGTDI